MPHPLETGTLSILKPDGSTAGTGFLVSKRLAVTCAHVVAAAKSRPGEVIKFKFHLGGIEAQEAKVLENGWSKENDVAILELTDKLPKWIHPIIMQSSRAMEGRAFQGLGYPNDGPVQTRWPQGNISGRVEVAGYANPLLQMQGKEIDKGLSGSAVVDHTTRRVIGMITAYQDISRPSIAPNMRFGYAIPIETIWNLYPELEKELPPLLKRSPLLEGIHLLPNGYDFRIQNFLSEYLGSPEQPEPFGGREDALKALDDWLDNDTQRLVLAAPAGRGKSALLVRWLDRLMVREDLALVFVPVSVRFRTNLASTFFASLAARLAYLHGEDVPTSETTSTDVWREIASTYLTKPLMDERKILVVLDGLDEAGDWEATADLIPSELPKNVRLVVSARFLAGDPDARPWLSRLGWEHTSKATILELEPLDSSGVADVLLRMGVPLDKLSHRVDIVSVLHRLSEGDPLLVNLYVEDLWSRGQEVSRLQSEDLKYIEPGYEGYFTRWWEDQRKLWGTKYPLQERTTRLVFNLLCGALGGLTIDDLAMLDMQKELYTYEIEDALIELRRFIIGVPDERKKKQIGYVLSHPKLRDYFWGKLIVREREEIESCFIHWGESVMQAMIEGKMEPNELPIYLLQYYGEHLERSHSPLPRFLAFVNFPFWHHAWFSYEGAYGGYLKDVQRIWEICKRLDRNAIKNTNKALYIGTQIRCAFIKASLHSLAGKVPPKLLSPLITENIWTVPQAWAVIRLMTKPDQQAQAISLILPFLTDAQIPEMIREGRNLLNDHYFTTVLRAFADCLHGEKLHVVLDAMQTINSPYERAQIFSTLAKYNPAIFGKALKTLKAVRVTSPINVLLDLALHVQEGQTEQILDATQNMLRDEWSRSRIYCVLARHLPETELMRVMKAAQEIDDVEYRATVLSALAQRFPEIADEALVALRKVILRNLPIPNYDVLDSSLIDLIRYLPEENLSQIWEVVREIRDHKRRAKVLGFLARRLPDAAAEALEAAHLIGDEEELIRALKDLVECLPKHQLINVLELVRTLHKEEERAYLLGFLATRLPEVAKEADAALTKLGERKRIHRLSDLAKHLSESQLEEMIVYIQEARDYRLVAEVSRKLIKQLSDRTLSIMLPKILEVVRGIEDEEIRADLLQELSQRQPKILSDASTVLFIIGDKREYTYLLSTLAQYLPETLEETLDAIRTIQSKHDRQALMYNLAEHLPKEHLSHVLAAMTTIEYDDGESPVSALDTLARRLPREQLSLILKIARTRSYRRGAHQLLDTLARRVPEELTLLSEILQISRSIVDDHERAHLLILLSKHLPILIDEALKAISAIYKEQECAQELILLIENLPNEKLVQALSIANTMKYDVNRAAVFCKMTPRLPELKDEAIQVALAISGKVYRAKALADLAPHMPELVDETLEAVREIRDGLHDQTDVLIELAQKLPEVQLPKVLTSVRHILKYFVEDRAKVLTALSQRLPEVTEEALLTIQSISDEKERAELLGALAPYLPETKLIELINVASEFGHETYRDDLLSSLSPAMQKMPVSAYYDQIESFISKSANQTRHRLLLDTRALIPLLICVGPEDFTRELLKTLRDVSQWWK